MKKNLLLITLFVLISNFLFAFDNSLIRECFNKEFIYESPDVSAYFNNETKKSTIDVSKFSKKEKKFYYEKVGSYFDKDQLTYDYFLKNIFSLRNSYSINDIKFYRFGYSHFSIDCSFKQEQVSKSHNSKKEILVFSENDGGSMEIKDISKYKLPKNKEKVEKNYFENLLEKRNKDLKNLPKTKVDEKELRKLFIDFFTTLEDDNFSNVVDNYVDFSNLKADDFSGYYKKISKQKFCEHFIYRKETFPKNFKVLVNAYYSESPKVISDSFGDCTLVELYISNYDYFSFVVKKVDSSLKIVGFRNDLCEI